MDSYQTKIHELLNEKCYVLSEQNILDFNETWNNGDLNNVVVGRHKECFGVYLINDGTDKNYNIIYVTVKRELTGHLLKMNIDDPDRDAITYSFSQYLAQEFDNLDAIDTFNAFQEQVASMLETLGFLTMNPMDFKKFGDHSSLMVMKGKKGLKKVTMLYKGEFYRELFGEKEIKPLAEGNKYIYVMINKRNNLFKIGNSKHLQFREKTLQGEDPEVELVTHWQGPISLEKMLHKHLGNKRKRGEWFKLSLADINVIKDLMKEYS